MGKLIYEDGFSQKDTMFLLCLSHDFTCPFLCNSIGVWMFFRFLKCESHVKVDKIFMYSSMNSYKAEVCVTTNQVKKQNFAGHPRSPFMFPIQTIAPPPPDVTMILTSMLITKNNSFITQLYIPMYYSSYVLQFSLPFKNFLKMFVYF